MTGPLDRFKVPMCINYTSIVSEKVKLPLRKAVDHASTEPLLEIKDENRLLITPLILTIAFQLV